MRAKDEERIGVFRYIYWGTWGTGTKHTIERIEMCHGFRYFVFRPTQYSYICEWRRGFYGVSRYLQKVFA